MREGLGVFRLRDGRCALRRGDAILTVEGIAFPLLRRVVDRLAQQQPRAAHALLRAADYARADARALVAAIASTDRHQADTPARLFSERQLARHLQRRVGVAVRVCFDPPAERLPPVASAPLLFVGPSRWWLGPLGRACVECALLRFTEDALPPAGDPGDAVHHATDRALLLGAATLGLLEAGARASAHVAREGWLCGELNQIAMHFWTARHPACDRCGAGDRPSIVPPPPVLRAGAACPLDEAAALARAALARMRLATVEHIDTPRAATFRDLPIVRLGWRRAHRPGDDIVVHEATQVGSGASREQRLVSARVEAVERVLVATRAPDLRACSLRAMREDHLAPSDWVLFSPAQYADPQLPCAPIDRDTPLDWVRGFDFARRRWIWLPLDLVNGAGGHLPASSTGAAAHTSLERVVVAGLLEILEREALQLLWIRGLSPRVIAPRRLGGEPAEQLTWLEGQGWKIHLLYAPGRAARHVVGVLGEVARPRIGRRRGGCLFTAAASGRLAVALTRALTELVTAVEVLAAFPTPAPRGPPDLDAAWSANDPHVIQQLYRHPAMRPALDFFLAGEPLRDIGPDRPDRARELVSALVKEGLRPIFVDCTVPGCAPLRAGKMLLVGALPHVFATGQLRLTGASLPAPPRRPLAPPRPGYRPPPGEANPYPFPLG